MIVSKSGAIQKHSNVLLLYCEPADMAYQSVDGFQEMIGRYLEAGIEEFIIDYPLMDKHMPVLEKIIRFELPNLRDGID